MIKKEYFGSTGWSYLLISITYLIISIWIFFTNPDNPSLKIGLIGVGVGTFSISIVYFIEFLRGPERLIIKRIPDTLNNILKIVEKKKANEAPQPSTGANKNLNRAPSPYEARRDFLQIYTNVLLTTAIIILMALQIIDKIIDAESFFGLVTRAVIILALVILLVAIFFNLRRFHKNWISWVKKK